MPCNTQFGGANNQVIIDNVNKGPTIDERIEALEKFAKKAQIRIAALEKTVALKADKVGKTDEKKE